MSMAAAVVCWALGGGLLAGAVVGGWAAGAAEEVPADRAAWERAGELWREETADTLLPPVLVGDGAGPGGADRRWTRTAVAADGPCAPALGAEWNAALAPVGCTRLLRATYTDATRSSLLSVGLVFTPAGRAATDTLRTRFEPAAPPPRAYGLADRQRASWAVSVLPDAPVVVYAVSAFADGRAVDRPRPAAAAGATTPAAQSGLAHEARAVTDRLERALRRTAATPHRPEAGR
ncbi:hypothetical protein LG634_36775 [Streptomyces bambusae]|nr:hypothetical protein [Streptomyces bambusae]MCB5170337.1 hypothetical protein [Streptomyces bambusae]